MNEDEAFAEIVGEFEDDFLEDLLKESQDFRGLTNVELMRMFLAVKQDLLDRGVLLHPTEEDDVDKQARYYGMLHEMSRRGLR